MQGKLCVVCLFCVLCLFLCSVVLCCVFCVFVFVYMSVLCVYMCVCVVVCIVRAVFRLVLSCLSFLSVGFASLLSLLRFLVWILCCRCCLLLLLLLLKSELGAFYTNFAWNSLLPFFPKVFTDGGCVAGLFGRLAHARGAGPRAVRGARLVGAGRSHLSFGCVLVVVSLGHLGDERERERERERAG